MLTNPKDLCYVGYDNRSDPSIKLTPDFQVQTTWDMGAWLLLSIVMAVRKNKRRGSSVQLRYIEVFGTGKKLETGKSILVATKAGEQRLLSQ